MQLRNHLPRYDLATKDVEGLVQGVEAHLSGEMIGEMIHELPIQNAALPDDRAQDEGLHLHGYQPRAEPIRR